MKRFVMTVDKYQELASAGPMLTMADIKRLEDFYPKRTLISAAIHYAMMYIRASVRVSENQTHYPKNE